MFGATVSTFGIVKIIPINNIPIVSGLNQALSLCGVASKSNAFINDIRSAEARSDFN